MTDHTATDAPLQPPAVGARADRGGRPPVDDVMALARTYAHAYASRNDAACSVAYEALKAAVTATEQPWKERFRWLAAQHWVEPEATFRLGLQETDNAAEYERQLIAAVDTRIVA